jgi:hypothetical protein
VELNGRARRASRGAAVLAVLVITDAVLGDLWSERHELGVAHQICAQHGARTHAVPLAAPAGATRALEARTGGAPSLRRVCQSTPARHEHCTVAVSSDLREPAPSTRSTLRLAPPPPAAAAPEAERRPRALRRSLLAAAPKTSPPRASETGVERLPSPGGLRAPSASLLVG